MGRVCNRFKGLLFAITLLMCVPTSNFAQPPTPGGVSSNLGASTGARRYRPGAWGLVEFRAVNRTDEDADVQAVLRFVDAPTIQYSQRATVPPHSILRSACPVLVPDSIAANTRYIDFLTEQIQPRRAIDPANAPTPQETLLKAQPMLLDNEDPTVGMVSELQHLLPREYEASYHLGPFPPWPEPDVAIYEMMLAAKRARRLSRRISAFDPGDLPSDAAGLDVLDVLVLSSDRLASDPAGIASVRDWVMGGGHLWIMLHDVQATTVAAVMGDAFACTVVDRVELTSAAMYSAFARPDAQEVQPIEFDEPVRFARVLPEDVTTTYTIDGWPAAFWQPFGSGSVYFTTAGPAAWMRPSTPGDTPPRTQEDATNFVARDPLDDLANDILAPRDTRQQDREVFKPFLSQQIGYQILNRWTVLSILGLFCGLLVCAGWWFYRQGHLERILWAAPLTAALFGLVFLGLGTATKRSVPPTVATITQVVLERGVGVGHASGLIALYNQDANRELLGAQHGGIFFPDMTALGGRNRRITWTDEGAWHWEDLELPAGVRTAPFERPLVLKTALDCRAQFGPDGLHGFVGPLLFSKMEDAVIVIPHHNVMAASIGDDGTIRSGRGDVLARGEFMSESLLRDKQIRRKSVYSKLLGTEFEPGTPTRPVLYAWSNPLDMGFIFPQPHRRESTIFSIPMRLENTPPGTEVWIPAPFLPYRAVESPEGKPPTAYANLRHEWVECKLATTEWLRFQMPPSVFPLELSTASISLNVRAPSRSVEILALDGDELVVISRLTHPIGTFACMIDRPELLQLDATGGLRLAIRASQDESADPKDQMTQAVWTIEELLVTITGTVQGE